MQRISTCDGWAISSKSQWPAVSGWAPWDVSPAIPPRRSTWLTVVCKSRPNQPTEWALSNSYRWKDGQSQKCYFPFDCISPGRINNIIVDHCSTWNACETHIKVWYWYKQYIAHAYKCGLADRGYGFNRNVEHSMRVHRNSDDYLYQVDNYFIFSSLPILRLGGQEARCNSVDSWSLDTRPHTDRFQAAT